eukprot:CAMPEP_0171068628 /NCGR_PEP_ID=MMETSP0766_2-20121228/8679_1 /TAXON_ID=439317 /ORGANISM="Gambierdiscus australes, Strain CAWD 149" /LENGTH=211 /DNA_ID=CAMNT_0011524965 /DNA_START=257 /DNA_END=888 /DNA_ORIENTATION=+
MNLLQEMDRRGLPPDIVSCCAVISSYGNCGRWGCAVHILEEVRHRRLRANAISFNAAISACEKGERPDAVLALLEEMRWCELRPDEISYNAAIRACKQQGKLDGAKQIFQELQLQGAKPGLITFNSMLTVCCANHSEGSSYACRLLQDMHMALLNPDFISRSLVARACERAGGYGLVLTQLREMRCEFVCTAAIWANTFERGMSCPGRYSG